jgi:hypothetical protein
MVADILPIPSPPGSYDPDDPNAIVATLGSQRFTRAQIEARHEAARQRIDEWERWATATALKVTWIAIALAGAFALGAWLA